MPAWTAATPGASIYTIIRERLRVGRLREYSLQAGRGGGRGGGAILREPIDLIGFIYRKVRTVMQHSQSYYSLVV